MQNKDAPFSVELQSVTDAIGEGCMRLKAEVTGQVKGPIQFEWGLDGDGMLMIEPADRSRALWIPAGANAGMHIVTVKVTHAGGKTEHSRSEIEILSNQPQGLPVTASGFGTSGKVGFGTGGGGGTQSFTADATGNGGGSTRPRFTAVALQRTENAPTTDLALWVVIRKATEALSFDNYSKFMDSVLCGAGDAELPKDARHIFNSLRKRRALPFTDSEAYRLLKVATEAFLMVNCGVAMGGKDESPFGPDDQLLLAQRGINVEPGDLDIFWNKYRQHVNGTSDPVLPYFKLIREKLRDSPLVDGIGEGGWDQDNGSDHCYGIIKRKLTHPCFLELIWSYWHEEGMLVQTMNAITTRFQNVRGPGDNDPLRMMEIDPLRPLNNLLWGFIQDEQHRLTVVRRAYEYNHHYGLTLFGKSVPRLQAADSRSRFIESFHNLLYLGATFFKQDDDTTIIADGFPLLNALKGVHLLLTEGAHCQFGELPSTSRIEMLMQQWMLARPEFREYLPTRISVAYPERWMDRVDAMKTLQRWTDTPVMHFRDLAVFGEQILLSIRFGAWATVNDPLQAANWARFHRSAIQGYNYAYGAATGVELTSEASGQLKEARAAQPWVHLKNRLALQNQRRA